MTSADFYRRMIAEWEAESKAASEAGDDQAFQVAQRELETYKKMLGGSDDDT